jgi:hypothetical protein
MKAFKEVKSEGFLSNPCQKKSVLNGWRKNRASIMVVLCSYVVVPFNNLDELAETQCTDNLLGQEFERR